MVHRQRALVLLFAILFASLIAGSSPPTPQRESAGEGGGRAAVHERLVRLPPSATRLAAILHKQRTVAPKLGPSSAPHGHTGRAAVALTFDDGPDPRWTPRVLALLRRLQIKATFCVLGSRAREYPALIRQMVTDGHTLCNHSLRHDLFLRRKSPRQIATDLRLSNDLITKAGGVAPRYFRAPGGGWSAPIIAIAQQLGMRPLGWSVDPQDWRKPPVGQLIASVTNNTRPGSIILLHDSGGDRGHTYAALRTLLPDLRRRFTLIPL